MGYISFVSTHDSGSLEFASQTAAFGVSASSSGPEITLRDYGYGGAQKFQFDSGRITLVDEWELSEEAQIDLDIDGYGEAAIGENHLIHSVNEHSTGSIGAITATLDYTGLGRFTDEVAIIADTSGSSTIAFVAASDGNSITSFEIDSSGSILNRYVLADTDNLYLDKVSDIEIVTIGPQKFLFAASMQEHGISGFSYSDTGVLNHLSNFGQSEDLPVQTMTALASGTSGGVQFLIGAASGSSSISVMSIDTDGSLKVTDHAIDSLDTRFANITQLEAVTHNDRLYILASGNDDGISLLTVTAEGRLVHLETMADSVEASLGGVSAMAATLQEGGIDLLTVAAHEAGMSHFHIDLPENGITKSINSGNLQGSSGDDMLSLQSAAGQINAGAGDDLISDGAGSDTLSGGTGKDIFVLQADGQKDVITDINLTEDRLDLSSWFMFQNVEQLHITSTQKGAEIQYGNETLRLESNTNSSLDKDDIAQILTSGPSHIPVFIDVPQAEADQTFIGTADNDEIKGGSGNDHIKGEAGDDTVFGGDGDDGIIGGAGHDLIYAGDGDDNVPGKAGNDTIYGEDGNDLLGGSDGFDFIDGGAGNDVAGGGNHNDTMDAGSGEDWFSGGWGNDIVMGNAGDDKLAGSYDHDTVEGGDGNDSMGGGMGQDLLDGGNGDDVLGAGEGNDTLIGGLGNDSLGGADDNDILYGGAGADTLNGAHGNDTLEGGEGADIFFFNNFLSSGTDIITDFEAGVDKLRLVGVHLGPEGSQIDKLNLMEGEFEGETGTWLDYGRHDIFLSGISEKELSEDDFSFN